MVHQPPPESIHNAQKSYFPASKSYTMSDAMRRARRPYLFRNIMVGSALTAFVGGTYLYVIKTVGQEDFSDIPSMPQQKRLQVKSIEDEEREKMLGSNSTSLQSSTTSISSDTPDSTTSPHDRATTTASTPENVTTSLPSYSLFWSSLLAAGWTGKGAANPFVVDAPEVDKLGKVGDRTADAAANRLV